jgi:outer membrane receptor for ferrienterochelin and colicins
VSVRNPVRSICGLPLVLVVLLHAPALFAQGEGIVPLVEGDRRVYAVEQFARFAPQTAADLAGQIPGFSVTNVSNDRGLGEASQNVLINGQRITGKGNDAMTVLRRIPVTAVRRLEIVDGATLDITGLAGQVLNVITEQGSVTGNYLWRPQFRKRVGNHLPAGEASVSGKTGIGDFTAGLRWDGFRGGGWGEEIEDRPATDVSVQRDRDPRFGYDQPKLSGSFNHKGEAGSIWNLNASLGRAHDRRHVIIRYQEPGESPVTEDSRGKDIKWITEIGADYEQAAGVGRWKLVGFYSQRHGPEQNSLTTAQQGEVTTGNRFARDSKQGERVLRSEYRWRALASDWTVSAEGAWNFIDATGTYAELDAMGQYQPLDLAGASSRVEERRGESILGFSRPVGAGWSMQFSGGAEYSQLRQDGAGGQTRSFWRPKASLSLAWNGDSPWETNLRLQRKIGQLNFFDFLAFVNVENQTANGGNPELVPPQSWLLQMEVTRSLGTAGKLRFNVEGERIRDLVAQVPLNAQAEAPGNLPRAHRLQASLDGSVLLDGLGFRGGRLETFITVRESRVRDPLTGEHRRLNGNRGYWNAEFRHDVPGTPWTWGLFLEKGSTSYSYRLDYLNKSWSSRPFGSVFVEHKNLLGLKVRTEIANLYRSHDRSLAVNYADRRDGPVDYTRDFNLSFGWIYRLQVSGTF